ncbi:crossover junction endodeoxyribonuclease RuvC [Niallia circulans]|uniref:crossover junction endodeoxyribonuclease RuvC n=1 Tax=Niallia circulans TaxID=1397 RepID=UPI000AAEB860|nr:crossover junction endodeoxyribonuclease RuvC [Niallia circulans]MED3839330.1 crossover junction endodeoxyribonuclease RuvC [Niallia circulans]MED4245313.1 crossover junction endodeoxyribonuclease RuvC [Niallia circulans]MED4250848.1 crossover junction endodeoxyribonuclease RuvC [Niallia circulans]SPT82959.1 crossover junction endodeoxyribonuclease RuvC [Niallia circulans]
MRVLAFDTSMSSPGVALLEVKNGKAKVLAVSHVKTTASQPHGLRAEIVEAWAVSFIHKHGAKFDVIVREDFVGRTSKQAHPVYSAWGAIDQALNKFGLNFTTPAISQSAVKKAVVGVGKAEKDEVAAAVREWTGYTGEFACDDESDAVAIGLAYLINSKIITKE